MGTHETIGSSDKCSQSVNDLVILFDRNTTGPHKVPKVVRKGVSTLSMLTCNSPAC